MMKANDVVGASNVKGNPTLVIVAALADQYRPDELHAVAIRLMAPSKLLRGGLSLECRPPAGVFRSLQALPLVQNVPRRTDYSG